jgi:phosphoribosylformylglycinamidine synthase I
LNQNRICIARVAGTNRDGDVKRCIEHFGIRADVVHVNELIKRKRELEDYEGLVFPGGFAYGDHVRAGAIWAAMLKSNLIDDLRDFVKDGNPILGVCNGFQVLVELGLLPGIDENSAYPEAALANNESGRFECRWVHLKNVNLGKCIFTSKVTKCGVVKVPIAHGEGRFSIENSQRLKALRFLKENDQIVFKYATPNGKEAKGRYPDNPNGSISDIAGICDRTGLIFGLMPHPEDAFFGYQLPDWHRSFPRIPKYGSGYSIFKSLADYVWSKN